MIQRQMDSKGKGIGHWARIIDTTDWLCVGQEASEFGIVLRADHAQTGTGLNSARDGKLSITRLSIIIR